MIEKILAIWNANAVIRDFVEGALSAAAGGAITAVLALSLDTASSKVVAMAAIVGAISALIAYMRRKLEQSQEPPK